MNVPLMAATKRYQAILFDLYDTLVDLQVERFPLVKIGENERRSTAGVVYQALQEFYDHVSFEEFFQTFVITYLEVDEFRKQTCREILAQERFRLLLQRVGIESPPASTVERLVNVHMDQMFAVMEFPPSRRRVLETLRPTYHLGIVSNFDHPPTAHRMLRHYDLDSFFDTVVISGEAGWRKPHKEIFRQALAAVGVPPQKSLYVGDTPDADIVGAQGIGMDVVWLDHNVTELDPQFPRPNYTIHGLEELLSILPTEGLPVGLARRTGGADGETH